MKKSYMDQLDEDIDAGEQAAVDIGNEELHNWEQAWQEEIDFRKEWRVDEDGHMSSISARTGDEFMCSTYAAMHVSPLTPDQD